MSTFDKQKFGQRFREMRLKAGYARQIDLAEKLGTVVQTISNYESGNRLPDAEMLSRIVEVLPCNADYLLGFEDKPTYSEAYITSNLGLYSKSIDVLRAIARGGADKYDPYTLALNMLISGVDFDNFLFAFYSYVFGGEECFIAGVDVLTRKRFKIAADPNTLGVFPCDGVTMNFQGFAAGGFKQMVQDASMARMQQYLVEMRKDMLKKIDDRNGARDTNLSEEDLQEMSDAQNERLILGVRLAEIANDKVLQDKKYGKH